jgi:hypothetical protein
VKKLLLTEWVEKTIVVNRYLLWIVTKVRIWNKDYKVYTHFYYSAKNIWDTGKSVYKNYLAQAESNCPP